MLPFPETRMENVLEFRVAFLQPSTMLWLSPFFEKSGCLRSGGSFRKRSNYSGTGLDSGKRDSSSRHSRFCPGLDFSCLPSPPASS